MTPYSKPSSARDNSNRETSTKGVHNRVSGESLHPALDSAAVAAAMAMPNWAPATKEGKAISTTITLPVLFRMD